MAKIYYPLVLLLLLFTCLVNAQDKPDTKPDSLETWNMHSQLTVIDQKHSSFYAAYSGLNSLNPDAEEALSLTTTLFFGRKLWKNAAVYFNPEIAGGSGVSGAHGVAGFTNGETFRIGNPTPTLYLARLFIRQYIPLSAEMDTVESDKNQLREYVPKKRITITAGKFGLSDLFDNNTYSHDPRTQFMNWALMSNGAWDYPANVRGYTDGIAVEYITPEWAVRLAGTLEPTYANSPDLDYRFYDTYGSTLELTRNTDFAGHKGKVNFLAFRNVTRAPVYQDVINAYLNGTDPSLNAIYGTKYGNVKYGFGINAEQEITKYLGGFLRGGWNDGKTATWAFTEIDRTGSIGFNYTGDQWKRPDDSFNVAVVVNGISAVHREFLNLGGYGFIIGDGKLTNYSAENILETYYSAQVNKTLTVAVDYQFVQNPAYNADRGPVNFFSLRAHVEF